MTALFFCSLTVHEIAISAAGVGRMTGQKRDHVFPRLDQDRVNIIWVDNHGDSIYFSPAM